MSFIRGIALLGLIALVGAGGAGACARPEAPVTQRTKVRIATGLPSMTFKALGGALASALASAMPDVDFEVVETPGSVSNLKMLDRGDAEIGLALADVSFMAYSGQLPELGTPGTNLSGVAVLHSSVVHLLVHSDKPIVSIGSLRGHRLGVGPDGSGTAVTSSLLLRAFGVPKGSVDEQPLPFSDATNALVRGDLSATFIVAADPVDAVRRATEAGAKLVSIDGPLVARLRANYPFFRTALIPGGMYPGHPRDVPTVRVDVLLLCRKDLDEGLVHRMTLALFQVLPNLTGSQNYLKLFDPRRAPATPIPLHPGAAWYYREKELSR